MDCLPSYVRSERNLFPDGLTRWAFGEIEHLARTESMTPIDSTSQLWAEMAPPYDPSPGADTAPNAFAILGRVINLYRACKYRVCEWGAGLCDVEGVLGNCGVAVFSGHVIDEDIRDRLPGGFRISCR